MNKMKGNEIILHIEDMIYKETQVQDYYIFLTAKRIFTITKRGDVDFGGGEYKESEIKEIHPVKISPEDNYGWWSLKEGQYLIEYNEKIKESIPKEDIIIVQPSLRLIRNGSSHPSLVVSEPGGIATILYVGKRGITIKQNARISILLIINP